MAPSVTAPPVKTERAPSRVELEGLRTRHGAILLAISGRLYSATTGQMWAEANNAVPRAASMRIILDASRIDYCDGSGIALLAQLRHRQESGGGAFEIRGLRPEFEELLKTWGSVNLARSEHRPSRRKDLVVGLGKGVVDLMHDG